MPPPGKYQFSLSVTNWNIQEPTGSTLYDITDFIISIIGTRIPTSNVWLTSYKNSLPTNGCHLCILDTTKFIGHQPCTVDDQICLVARLMSICGFADMFKNSAPESNPGFETLSYQIGKINCCIDADRCKCCSKINPWCKLILRYLPKLGFDVQSQQNCSNKVSYEHSVPHPSTMGQLSIYQLDTHPLVNFHLLFV